MKNIESNTIHFQVTGDNSSPDNIPWKKLKSIVEAYINLISSFNVHLLNGEEFTLNEFFLTNINACCTDITFAVESAAHVQANDLMVDTYKLGNITDLPDQVKNSANLLNNSLLEQNLAIILFTNAGDTVHYEPIIYDFEEIFIKERRTLYGRMHSIGGKVPNFHVEDLNRKNFIIDGITEDIASKLAPRLYQTIGVLVEADINLLTMEMQSKCKYIQLLPYIDYDDQEWFELNEKFVNSIPNIFNSEEEMHNKLSDIRRGSYP